MIKFFGFVGEKKTPKSESLIKNKVSIMDSDSFVPIYTELNFHFQKIKGFISEGRKKKECFSFCYDKNYFENEIPTYPQKIL